MRPRLPPAFVAVCAAASAGVSPATTLVGVILATGLAFFAGCGGSSTLGSRPAVTVSDGVDRPPPAPAAAEIALNDIPVCAHIEELIRSANAAATDGEYALAHRLAGAAARLIEAEAGHGEAEQTASDYYARIARIYAGELPAAYADSAPDAISMFVFQSQMMRGYDSLAGRLPDSAVDRMLACQRGTRYDLPVTYNKRVLGALMMFSNARKDQMNQWLSRARQYVPLLKSCLADSGLPQDLAYLPLIESGFNPRAYSYAHASGIWQFIPGTGDTYGLRRDYWLDERRDPLRATRAAASYLKKLYAEFGNWHLALAAYNCGENGVQRTLQSSGSRDFWALGSLPQQTREYVPKFLAALVVARNPGCFGFSPADTPVAQADTVLVSECLDLAGIAKAVGATNEQIEALNPHILRWCTPPDIEAVTLYLPSGSAPAVRDYVAGLGPQDKVKWRRYVIQAGDNLISIARRFNTAVPALRSVNRLGDNRIVAGRELFIPVPADARGDEAALPQSAPPAPPGAIRYLVKRDETLSEIAATFGVGTPTICKWNKITDDAPLRAGSVLLIYLPKGKAERQAAPPPHPSPLDAEKRTYTVLSGDNFSNIARSLGVTLADLLVWNGRDAANPMLRPGEDLVYYVPRGTPAPAAVEPAPAAPPTAAATPPRQANTAAPAIGDTLAYAVAAGDNLSRIADLFGAKMDDLLRVNGLTRDSLLRTGRILKVPLRRNGRPGQTGAKNRERLVLYQVKKGDNVWSVAQLFGVPVERVYAANGLDASARIRPGDTLKILLPEDL